ncbi:MAG: carbamate kinase [Candidatus Cloacimonetes bacterium]|nr:carbamate kinase [Candidatus Cloacimonadota bacterium]
MNKKIVLALGGNAIIQAGQKGTISEQFANTRDSLNGIADLIKSGYQIAISHGNGPQVGNMLIQQNAGIEAGIAPLPLGVLNAATEGTMGYMIDQSLQNILKKAGVEQDVAVILTQVVVDKNDPSMQSPSKPVGPFYTEAKAKEMQNQFGWTMVEDAGRGWRQVVPSPKPIDIIPAKSIKTLMENGTIVISCGGGGIPVYVEENNTLEGVDAVIDKDFASALLANQIQADTLIILTGVEKVAINWGKPEMKELSVLNVEDAKRYHAEGHFPKGSMGPKILAAIDYLEKGGKRVIITSHEFLSEALAGKTGTIITLN